MKEKGLNGFSANDSETDAPSDYQIHTVKKGESLWLIAEKYLGSGARYPEIKKLNDLKEDTIYPGQTLKIPKK
jgi:LysM repeat protein